MRYNIDTIGRTVEEVKGLLDRLLSDSNFQNAIAYLSDKGANAAADDARAFVDSMLTLVWTLAGGALSLLGIIGAFATVIYQLKATEAIKAYEELAKLQGFNDPSISEAPSEDEVKKRAGQVRKDYVSFANRLKMLNGSFGMDENKCMLLIIPVFFVWVAGCILLAVRTLYWGAGNLNLISQLLILSIFPTCLGIVYFFLKRFMRNSRVVNGIPSIREALDTGYEGVDVLGNLLSTTGVYVTGGEFGGVSAVKFSISYAVPFHSYKLTPEISFYNAANSKIALLPNYPEERTRDKEYQSDLLIQGGGHDSFMVQIPSGADYFKFRLIYISNSKKRISPYLFSINNIELSELDGWRAKFVECGSGWQIPQRELERYFNDNWLIHLSK